MRLNLHCGSSDYPEPLVILSPSEHRHTFIVIYGRGQNSSVFGPELLSIEISPRNERTRGAGRFGYLRAIPLSPSTGPFPPKLPTQEIILKILDRNQGFLYALFPLCSLYKPILRTDFFFKTRRQGFEPKIELKGGLHKSMIVKTQMLLGISGQGRRQSLA